MKDGYSYQRTGSEVESSEEEYDFSSISLFVSQLMVEVEVEEVEEEAEEQEKFSEFEGG